MFLTRTWLVKSKASYNITVCTKKNTKSIFTPELHAQLMYECTHWERESFSSCYLFVILLCSTWSVSKWESARGAEGCKGMMKETAGTQPCNPFIAGNRFTPDSGIFPVYQFQIVAILGAISNQWSLTGISWQQFTHAAYLNLGIKSLFYWQSMEPKWPQTFLRWLGQIQALVLFNQNC